MTEPEPPFVSRGGLKLDAALTAFGLAVDGLVCADLGSHVGGFVDCLLRRGAARVYSVDTAYGTLAWKLRKDDRVVVMERTNAMHVTFPEPVAFVSIDVGWTRQTRVLPAIEPFLTPDAVVVTLIKPQYEIEKERLVGGVVPDELVDGAVRRVIDDLAAIGWQTSGTVDSPIRGHGGNRELLALLQRPQRPR